MEAITDALWTFIACWVLGNVDYEWRVMGWKYTVLSEKKENVFGVPG